MMVAQEITETVAEAGLWSRWSVEKGTVNSHARADTNKMQKTKCTLRVSTSQHNYFVLVQLYRIARKCDHTHTHINKRYRSRTQTSMLKPPRPGMAWSIQSKSPGPMSSIHTPKRTWVEKSRWYRRRRRRGKKEGKNDMRKKESESSIREQESNIEWLRNWNEGKN